MVMYMKGMAMRTAALGFLPARSLGLKRPGHAFLARKFGNVVIFSVLSAKENDAYLYRRFRQTGG